MTSFRDLPELVQDSELEVIVQDAFTVHTNPLGCRDDLSPQLWATIRTLGRGGDGTVFLQQKIKGPGEITMLAVKQMSLDADLASEDHNCKRYVRELEALAKFAQGKYSRSFVRTYGWYQDGGWLYICMEYCQHLDLGKYLRVHGTLSEEHAKVIALQVLHGLLQMHRNQIAHRDLKPANILIHRQPPENEEWWVVLGDLGLSRRIGSSSGTTTIRGTPSYMAPETIGKPFLGDPKNADPFSADMWCLGETIARALTGQGTFLDNNQLLEYQARRVGFPDGSLKRSMASVDALNFIRSLMEVEPEQRPTATQALNHRWLKVDHSPDTAAASFMASLRMDSLTVIRNAGGEITGFNNHASLLRDQTTQASAQWTQTRSIRSDNTEASFLLDDDAVVSLRRVSADRSISDTTIAQPKEVPTINQAPISVLPIKHPPVGRIIERELDLFEFRASSAAEKLRLSQQLDPITTEEKAARLDDLKKFSRNLQLRTSIPADILPFLSHDKEKQRHPDASAKQQALIRKSEDEKQNDKTASALQEEQRPQAVYAPVSLPRQLYGKDALPPTPNPTLRPPPPALRPPLVSVKVPALPGNISQPQPQAKASSDTQSPMEQNMQLPIVQISQELARLRTLDIRSLSELPNSEATGSSTVNTSVTLGSSEKEQGNEQKRAMGRRT